MVGALGAWCMVSGWCMAGPSCLVVQQADRLVVQVGEPHPVEAAQRGQRAGERRRKLVRPTVTAAAAALATEHTEVLP
jgi:hypothetical protein